MPQVLQIIIHALWQRVCSSRFFPNGVSRAIIGPQDALKFPLTTKGLEGTHMQRQGLDHRHTTGGTLDNKNGFT